MMILFICTLFLVPLAIGSSEVNTTSKPVLEDGELVINSTAVSNISGFDPSLGRLPLSLRPYHYDLRLQAFIHGNRSVHGDLKIFFSVDEDTDQFIINMNDIITLNDTCKVTCVNSRDSPIIVSQTFDPINQFYVASLDRNLSQGSQCSFSMKYLGYLNSILVGFYFASFNDSEGIEHRLGMTQFSPTDARRAFPCFDEPGFKATFNISLLRQENMTALSNMPIISSEPLLDQPGWIEDHFDKTLKMSTYLVGFLISDFTHRTSDALNGTEFKVWTRPEAIDQSNFSLDVGPKLLNSLENYFGIDFPLPKLDMAAVPSFKFNGMENWGLIMYRESALLVDPERTTVDTKRRILEVVSHEIAHMWFGNLVTPKWWSELWLKEGFANFMGYRAVDEVVPEWKTEDYMAIANTYSALQLDGLKSSHPINVEVGHPDRISEIFDSISYNKGAAIIRMMHYFLTESVYRRGMTDYLNALQFDNAVQDDLWHYLTEAWKQSESFDSARPVKTVMDTWTLQDGYPVLNVSVNGTDVTITQERFLLQGNLLNGTEVPEKRSWWVPVSFTDQTSMNFEETEPKVWLSPNDTKIVFKNLTSSPDDWLILNIKKTGFYRVNYDRRMWEKIVNQLRLNHSVIHPLNRAQLIDDAFSLARAGFVDYNLTFDVISYMVDEKEYIPWTSFKNNFDYIFSAGEAAANFDQFKAYISRLLDPLFSLTGFSSSENEDLDVQRLRSLAVRMSCLAENKNCTENASKLFKLWLTLPSNESSSMIDLDTKTTVLCTGIKFGSEEDWNKTFNVYLTSNSQSEMSDILLALASTKDPKIIQRYLDMALDPSSGIKKQDSFSVFRFLGDSQEGCRLAWKNVQKNWPFIFEYFGAGSNALGRIIKGAGENLIGEQYVTELKKFGVDQKDKLGSARRSFKETLDTVTINSAWIKIFEQISLPNSK